MSLFNRVLAQACSKTGRQTVALYTAQVLALAGGLISVPIITRHLLPSQYGLFSFILALVAFVSLFFEFGLITAGARLLAHAKEPQEERSLTGGLILLTLLLSGLLALSLYLSSFAVDSLLHNPEGGRLLRLISILAGLSPLAQLVSLATQGINRIGRLAFFILFPKLLYLAGILLLLFENNINTDRLLILNFGSLILTAFLVLGSMRPVLFQTRSSLRLILNETRRYGIYAYFGRIVDVATYNLDSILISFFYNVTSVGYYSLATLLISPIVLLSESLTASLFKDFAKRKRIPGPVFLLNFSWLLVTLSLLVIVSSPLVTILFSDKYLPVVRLLPFLAIAGFFQGMYKPYNVFFSVHGEGKILQRASFITGAVNLIANLSLIPVWGASGAAIGSALGMGAYYGLSRYYYGQYLSRQHNASPLPDKEYFEQLYLKDPEPWGLDTRASQLVRYQDYLRLLKPYLNSDQLVLDIGCAKGQIAALLAPQVKEIIGIDISPEAVRQAKEQRPLPNGRYEVGSLPKLNFPDAQFDLVLPLEVLYYLSAEDQRAALAEIRRVTKPRGLILFSVNIGPKPYYQLEELQDLLARYFAIQRVAPQYGGLYHFWENKALVLAGTPLRSVVGYLLGRGTPVKIARVFNRLFSGKKGITMAYILVRNQ